MGRSSHEGFSLLKGRVGPFGATSCLVAGGLVLFTLECARPPAQAGGAFPLPEPDTAVDANAVDASDGGGLASIFLGEVETVNHLQALPAPGETIRMTLESTRDTSAAFGELRRRTGGKRDPGGAFTFEGSGYPRSRDPVVPRHRNASFVVDYDEPSVQRVRSEAVRACGPTPTLDQLCQFVDRYIDKKNMERRFDVASYVASHKEGDCTEHAVLLAAVARSFGHPARIVLGLAVVQVGSRVASFAHAWVEYHDAEGWKVADAAVPPETGARYVPLQVMDDEGPAFERHMLEGAGATPFLRRVVLMPAQTP